jgi:alkaline phosphatase D
MSQSEFRNRRGFLRSVLSVGAGLGVESAILSTRKAIAATSELVSASGLEAPPRYNLGPAFERKSAMAAGKKPQPTAWFPVLQGATSQTQTQFRVCVESNRLFRYYVVDARGTKKEVSPRSRFGVPTSQMVIDHLFVDGLEPGGVYQLEISRGSSSEKRWFSTLSPRSRVGDPLRLALISCMNDRYQSEQADAWESVADSTPELMIFNGDCCYVDQRSDGSVEGMWRRHLETRLMLDVFKWDRLVPVLTTWDDHDTGENDSNSSNPWLAPAAKYFDAMFGSDPVDGMTVSNGRSYSFDTHGMRFLLLDCRSNLSPTQAFSQTEEPWIVDQMRTSPGPTWLVNGTQFLGGYLIGAESVEKAAPVQMQRIFSEAAKLKVPIGLMTGDVHFSELMEIEPELFGYKSYEFTSSAIHSRTFPGQQFRSFNPRRVESTSKNNFMAIELTARSSRRVDFEVACLGSKRAEFFRLKSQIGL